MSREHVEFVKSAYEAFASGGLDGWMEQFAEDVDYRAVEGATDDIGPIRGRESRNHEQALAVIPLAAQDELVAARREGGLAISESVFAGHGL